MVRLKVYFLGTRKSKAFFGFNSTMVRLKGHVKCTAKPLNMQVKVQKNGSPIRRPPVVRKTLEVAEF